MKFLITVEDNDSAAETFADQLWRQITLIDENEENVYVLDIEEV